MLEASRPTWRLHGRARTTRLRRPQIVPFVDRHICVHRIPLHVRDDAYAPHQVRNGCEETSISGKTKEKYFCDGIWTGQISLKRLANLAFSRKRSCGTFSLRSGAASGTERLKRSRTQAA